MEVEVEDSRCWEWDEHMHKVLKYIKCCALHWWIKSLVTYPALHQWIESLAIYSGLLRWIVSLAMVLVYGMRVYYVGGFSITITYVMGFYLLYLIHGFLSPRSHGVLFDKMLNPPSASDEFKPFIRRLPEFKFWCGVTKAFSIAFLTTFILMFDIAPEFNMLLLLLLILFYNGFIVLKIAHMILYKYIPFDFGRKSKHKCGEEKTASNSNASSPLKTHQPLPLVWDRARVEGWKKESLESLV